MMSAGTHSTLPGNSCPLLIKALTMLLLMIMSDCQIVRGMQKAISLRRSPIMGLSTRAGPQSQKWSDQQITLNPTGSIHEKAREKKFDPKKVDFDEGVFI